VIITTSLHRDFLPSAWGHFTPTTWDVLTLLGSFGLFFTMFCLFVRFVPMVATSEVKTVLPEANPHGRSAPEIKAQRGEQRGGGELAPEGAS
jgi:molybdopterin-containing oxidoreductase family membrane subunit